MAVHRISSRRLAVVWLTAVLSIVSACADAPYERVNAYDPGLKVPGRIVGLPDTFFAFGDSAQLRLEVDERFRDIPISWTVRGYPTFGCGGECGQIHINSTTGTVVASPSSYRTLWEVRAQLGEQSFYDTVVTRQVPVRFRSICRRGCYASAFNVPIEYRMTDAVLLDANGSPLVVQSDTALLAGASTVVRDTSIAQFVNDTLRSQFTNGTTWIVRRQLGMEDSVQLTVHQRLEQAQLVCPQSVALGDTVRISVIAKDPYGNLLEVPLTYRWWLGIRSGYHYVERPISADGTFVPRETGEWGVFLRLLQTTPGGESVYEDTSCTVWVS